MPWEFPDLIRGKKGNCQASEESDFFHRTPSSKRKGDGHIFCALVSECNEK